MLKSSREEYNSLEIADITVSEFKTRDAELLFKMQDIKTKINAINEKILKREYNRDQMNQATDIKDELLEKLKRFQLQYNRFIAIEDMDSKVIKSKALKNNQNKLTEIEYVFVCFRNSLSAEVAEENF